jgi:hypothetical protein
MVQKLMKKVLFINEFTSKKSNSTGYLFHLLKRDVSSICSVDEINLEFYSKKFSNKIFNSFKLFFKILAVKHKYDIIILGTNPPSLIIIGSLMKYVFRAKLYLYLMDLFPHNLVAAGYLSRTSLVYRTLHRLIIGCFGKFDQIMVLGQDMKDLLINDGVQESKLLYYPIIVPKISNTFHIECNGKPNKDIIIQFFGNIGPLQNLKESIRRFNESVSSGWRLQIIGNGRGASELEHYVRRLNDPRIEYYQGVPMRDRDKYLARADIALVSLTAGSKGIAVPSKAYFNFASGIPVFAIVDEGSELYRVITTHDLGVVMSDANQCSIESMLEELTTKINTKYRESNVKERYSDYAVGAQNTRDRLFKLISTD